MKYLTSKLAVAAVAGSTFIGGADEANAQSIVDRLGVNVTHCVETGLQEVEDIVALQVHFKTDRCQINGDHIAAIERAIAEAQRRNPGEAIHAFVVGETDPRQTDAYNIRLGQGRANGLARALRARGVTVHEVASIGESQTPQHIRDNPESRNAWALLGDRQTILGCMASRDCTADVTVRSALRPDQLTM